MHINQLKYYAYDIDQEDIIFINHYFNIMKNYSKIQGKAQIADLSDLKSIKKIPRANLCFMFKFLDVIESKGHKLSEEIIKSLKCKYIVASFATKTVSGKNMNHPYRGWIEKMLNRLNMKFEKIQTPNEMFYIIKKESLAHR